MCELFRTFGNLYDMDVKEYLRTNKDINLSELARKMWPRNSDALSYLIRKLNGQRPFTEKDRESAKKHLRDLGVVLGSLE